MTLALWQVPQSNQNVDTLESALNLSIDRKVEEYRTVLNQIEPLNLSNKSGEENSTTPMQQENVSDVFDSTEGRLVIGCTNYASVHSTKKAKTKKARQQREPSSKRQRKRIKNRYRQSRNRVNQKLQVWINSKKTL